MFSNKEMKGLNQLNYIFSLKGKKCHFVKDKYWHFAKHSEFLHFGLVNVYKNGEQTEHYFQGSCTHPIYLAYTFFSVILVLVQKDGDIVLRCNIVDILNKNMLRLISSPQLVEFPKRKLYFISHPIERSVHQNIREAVRMSTFMHYACQIHQHWCWLCFSFSSFSGNEAKSLYLSASFSGHEFDRQYPGYTGCFENVNCCGTTGSLVIHKLGV